MSMIRNTMATLLDYFFPGTTFCNGVAMPGGAHLTQETCEDIEAWTTDDYGWIVYVPRSEDEFPSDLRKVMEHIDLTLHGEDGDWHMYVEVPTGSKPGPSVLYSVRVRKKPPPDTTQKEKSP